MYICKQLLSFRYQFKSISRRDTFHVVSYNKELQKLVCTCEGYLWHQHCKHIKEINEFDLLPCDWIGTSKDGSCPKCGEKVYPLSELDSVQNVSTLDNSYDLKLLKIGKFFGLYKDDQIYIFDESKSKTIIDLLLNHKKIDDSPVTCSKEETRQFVKLLQDLTN